MISLAEDIVLRGFAPFVRCQETINYILPSLIGQDQVIHGDHMILKTFINCHQQVLARLFRLHRLGQYLSNLKVVIIVVHVM